MTSGPATERIDPVMEEAGRLAEVLAASWRQGRCCPAEELLDAHPAVRDVPTAGLRVVYEEVWQRQELGQEVSLVELQARFPQWSDQLAVLLDCVRLLGLAPRVTRFPAVGETVGEFRLLAVLGRGASGRVYLAEQSFLAGRLTVLKLIPLDNLEHLKLARLQHTHIVPLYGVRDLPERNLRLLCMPCLGGCTLQQILGALSAITPGKRTGRDVLDALRAGTPEPRLFWPARGPNKRFLQSASYVQVVCWAGVCLADALQYAHEQGLLHLDVKPSNVLFTADCQPMLLDFHLAQGPLSAGQDAPEWLGGTVGYMSPEQEEALAACREQVPVPAAVDARSDVYSLGVLLREALCGEQQDDGDIALPSRADLSPALRDVLARCLARDPEARYPSAGSLADDLRRYLSDRPLIGVRNRSLLERWRKFSRRQPQALALAMLVAIGFAGLLAFGFWTIADASRRHREAVELLAQGQNAFAERRFDKALLAFDQGLVRLGGAEAGRELYFELRQQRQRAAEAWELHTLHELVERGRYLYGDDHAPLGILRIQQSQYKQYWHQRQRLLAALPPGPTEEQSTTQDMLDLAILLADSQIRLAAAGENDTARRAAQRVLEEAQSQYGRSAVLSRELASLDPATNQLPTVEPAPRTAWEHYAVGRWFLRSGNLESAAAAFDTAVELRPQQFWPWYGKAVCAYRRGQHVAAVSAFTVCIALDPDSAACYYNRGLAHGASGNNDAALRDYDHALRLDPYLGAARINRGVLYFQKQRFDEAEADYRFALDGNAQLGTANEAALRYNFALLCQARQEPAAALNWVEQALQIDSDHGPARDLQKNLHRLSVPAGPAYR
jgi:serine/threonine protein kinase/tetratricopeptide (TPR) repeat protein